MVAMPSNAPIPDTAPEQGQLARVRNRLWLVEDVIPAENHEGVRATRVDLECLDDDEVLPKSSHVFLVTRLQRRAG